MTPAEIRDCVLAQHQQLMEISEALRDLMATNAQRDEIRQRLEDFASVVVMHHRTEELLLPTLLPTIDAWGAVRRTQMEELHQRDHAVFEELLSAALDKVMHISGNGLLRELLQHMGVHMAAEERAYMNERVLRDDVVAIDEFGG